MSGLCAQRCTLLEKSVMSEEGKKVLSGRRAASSPITGPTSVFARRANFTLGTFQLPNPLHRSNPQQNAAEIIVRAHASNGSCISID